LIRLKRVAGRPRYLGAHRRARGAAESLTIEGKLSFANTADLELTTEWIMLHGELEVGTEARPHTRKATITLTNTVPDEEPMRDMGDRGIMISGGP
jgi:cell migration-inducing and hyaluronan-binding protein